MPIDLDPFNHVALRTKRLEESKRFYMEVLGFREISRPPFDFNGAWLFGGGVQIHLLEVPYDPMPVAINTRENHIAFACADLERAERVLQEHMVTYRVNFVPGRNTKQIFFRDPDGWLIELGFYTAPIDQ